MSILDDLDALTALFEKADDAERESIAALRSSSHVARCRECRARYLARLEALVSRASKSRGPATVRRRHPAEWYPDYRPTPGRHPDAFDAMPVLSNWKTFETDAGRGLANSIGVDDFHIVLTRSDGAVWLVMTAADGVLRLESTRGRWVLARVRLDVLDGVLDAREPEEGSDE